ncbi:MAG TPA: FAD-dependent monooxygenase [Pseudolabrys sp.]
MSLADGPAIATGVAIVGAGPVGLALANELRWRGVDYVIVDRAPDRFDFPTSEAINTRTMEHFRRWGIADKIRYAGFPPDLPRNVWFLTSVVGHEIAHLDRPSNRQMQAESRDISPEGMVWCPRMFFEPVLRQTLGGAGTPTFMVGWEARDVAQDDDGVRITLEEIATGRRRVLAARYLAACDGGSSTIRKALGIELRGNFAEGYNLSVYFRSPALREAMARWPGTMADIVNPEISANISTVDGDALWRLIVFVPDPTVGELNPRLLLCQAIGGDLPAEIISARPWYGHTVVADSFASGRILLAGDAAHLLWPRGGFGMNTGIGDAVDLGWKFAAMAQGWGGPRLLASYEAERKPIAARNVAEAAANFRSQAALRPPPNLVRDDETGVAARSEMRRVILAQRAKEWSSLGLQLGYLYDPSPICWDDGTSAAPFEVGEYRPTTHPGARAPHAWLAPGESLLDHFGHGFRLVHFAAHNAVIPMLAAAQELGVPLAPVALGSPAIAELYERRFVLVRPDGHVAWRGDEMPASCYAILNHARGA